MPHNTHSFDIHGDQLREVPWTDVFQAVLRIQRFFADVRLRFVERDDVIDKLLYAIMMREHVLLQGPTGTGKSHLLDTVLGGIKGATTWSMDLHQFTTNVELFGNYDIREMKETGRMMHMTEGSIAEAHFAKTGEFFDATDGTLRLLLGLLNERRIKRGTQEIKAPLLTVIADTNFKPEDMPTRTQRLRAVVDRFLFRASIGYIREPHNRYAMLELALDHTGHTPLSPLSLDDVVLVSGVIRAVDLVSDKYVRQAYEELSRRLSDSRGERGKPPISDRLFARGAQILEASALLHGRQVCTFEDLGACGHILCREDGDDEVFGLLLAEVTSDWTTRAQRRNVETELHRLEQVLHNVPANTNVAAMGLTELKHYVKGVDQILEQLEELRTDLRSFEALTELSKATTRCHQMLAQADMCRVDALLASLPQLEIEEAGGGAWILTQELSADLLKASNDQCQLVLEQLVGMTPRAPDIIAKHQMARDTTIKLISAIEMAFRGGRI